MDIIEDMLRQTQCSISSSGDRFAPGYCLRNVLLAYRRQEAGELDYRLSNTLQNLPEYRYTVSDIVNDLTYSGTCRLSAKSFEQEQLTKSIAQNISCGELFPGTIVASRLACRLG